MCSNYLPARIDSLAAYFDIAAVDFVYPAEAYPGNTAPILKAVAAAGSGGIDGGINGGIECVPACFGMVPQWADMRLARQTYNARTETVAEKPSFRSAWRKQQFCVVPLEAFFEPNYESGSAVRWKIAAANEKPLGVAGIWEWRKASFDGQGDLFSFSMLTINANGHSLMQRFHKPEDEKRMLVILPPEQYSAWLNATIEEAQQMLRQYPAQDLSASAAPRLLGAKRVRERTPPRSDAAAKASEPVAGGDAAQMDFGEFFDL